MKYLVTGSAGHLGEALLRTLRQAGEMAFGIDIKPSVFTDFVGSIVDRDFVQRCVSQADVIFHTATLHKPHVGTHSRAAFVDTNITGTLNLLEEAIKNGCQAFVYTSTTSVFGDAMQPIAGSPAVWVDEDLQPIPKNIYGVTKTAAEDLCQLFNRNTDFPCIVLRTSRFFLEPDDNKDKRKSFDDANMKVNELLYRRADIEDIVDAHRLAMSKAKKIGFGRFIISATTPFQRSDAKEIATDAPTVLGRYTPEYAGEYARRGWKIQPSIERVYDNTRAREILGWQPKYNFDSVIERLINGEDYGSELSRTVGVKGYHDTVFEDGPYPVGSF